MALPGGANRINGRPVPKPRLDIKDTQGAQKAAKLHEVRCCATTYMGGGMSYMLFIDESGRDLRESPYAVLAGIAVEDRDLWNW